MSEQTNRQAASTRHGSDKNPPGLCAEQPDPGAQFEDAYDPDQATSDLPVHVDRTTRIVRAIFSGRPDRQLTVGDQGVVDRLGSTHGQTITFCTDNDTLLTARARITDEVRRYVEQDMQTATLYDAVTHNPREVLQDLTSCPAGSVKFASQMRNKHRKTLASFPKKSEKDKKALSQGWWSECQQFVRDSQR